MSEIFIRKASLKDLPTLLLFEQGIINAERPFDPTLKAHPNRYYDIEELITAKHIELVVAELNSELIGCGYARIEQSRAFLQHTQHAYLGFMYVKPSHRGQGINKMIIEVLEQWSRSQRISEMRLEVYGANAPAIQAYEKVGFERHMIEMRKGLKK